MVSNAVKDRGARVASRLHSALYRLSRGRLGGRLGKSPVLLLTTTGRTSGKERTVPLLYLRDGERLAVVASYGGDERSPAWFHNLVAHPDVAVEIEGVRRKMRAEQADPAEKDRLWPRFHAMSSGYAKYQTKTDRDFPIVFLSEA